MRKINVREARQHIGKLLDAVTAGEEIIITRRGNPVAKLLKADSKSEPTNRFPSRRKFRSNIPPAKYSGSELIREMRDERG